MSSKRHQRLTDNKRDIFERFQFLNLQVEVKTKQLLETMSMVEEFMLLANISTGEATYRAFGQCAVLRRHPGAAN